MRKSPMLLAFAGSANAYLAVSGLIPSRDSARMQASADAASTDVAGLEFDAALDEAVGTSGGEPPEPGFDVRTLPGVSQPFGFFDPAGFTKDASEGKIRFYREVELKHCRVGMLAALGFPLAENFHPLFGSIDVPSYIAFQETPLQTFWPIVILTIATLEVFSVFTFNSPFGPDAELWSIRSDHTAGDLGFDPLGLKPSSAAELKLLQTKELNNGRLAMLAAAGMIAQELATGDKLF
jgi:light-harvesting complex I chlorophyll a/b binding protein 4